MQADEARLEALAIGRAIGPADERLDPARHQATVTLRRDALRAPPKRPSAGPARRRDQHRVETGLDLTADSRRP